MKKVFTIILVLTFVFLMIPFQANAWQPTDVRKGTPVIDGKLDDIYLQSACHIVKDREQYSWGEFAPGSNMPSSGKVYFLWDEDYLYICSVVEDATPTSKDGEKTWENDAIEHFIRDEGLRFKVHQAADGTFFLGSDFDGKATFEMKDAISKTTYTDTGYILETALPLSSLEVDMKFGYSAQLNDIWEPNALSGYAKGTNEMKDVYICSAEEAVSSNSQTTDSQASNSDTISSQPTNSETSSQLTSNPLHIDDNDDNNDRKNDLLIVCIVIAVAVVICAIIVIIMVKKQRGSK